MPSPRRIEKLNILFREQIAATVDREIEFAEGTFVTITRVVISSDARYAAVYISVFGGGEQDAFDLLKKNVYHIQQLINRAVRMRPVPKITFRIDEDEERRERVEQSIAQLKQRGEV